MFKKTTMNPTIFFYANLFHSRKWLRKKECLKWNYSSLYFKSSFKYLPSLSDVIRKCIEDCYFPNELKLAEIVSIYKKNYP